MLIVSIPPAAAGNVGQVFGRIESPLTDAQIVGAKASLVTRVDLPALPQSKGAAFAFSSQKGAGVLTGYTIRGAVGFFPGGAMRSVTGTGGTDVVDVPAEGAVSPDRIACILRGSDVFHPGDGRDHGHCGHGEGTLAGGPGTDILHGEAGADRLRGGIGRDPVPVGADNGYADAAIALAGVTGFDAGDLIL